VCASVGASLSAQVQTVTMPAGKTIEKALGRQVLGQEGGQPFHLTMEISVKAAAPDPAYHATIDETWLTKDHWVRTVTADGLRQTVIADPAGLHYVTEGDYFPLWLRSFVWGMFSPIPALSDWTRGNEVIEQKVFPNGIKSTACIHHEFMLGAETKQMNFANLCFNNERLLGLVQGPEFSVEFDDYAKFKKFDVPRTLAVESNGVRLIGKVTVLELASADARIPDVPASATADDPLRFVTISTPNLEKLAGDQLDPGWPQQIPGHGQFTVWVAIDRAGKVREVDTRNTDLSGFAADMARTLVGRQWKAALVSGSTMQVEGPLVFSYPREHGTAAVH
jgi:hypothetical protein